MKKVDLIHGGWLNAPNGASTVLRNFYNNKHVFYENCVDMEFYTMELINPKFTSNDSSVYKKETLFSSRFKGFVKLILNKFSRFGISIFLNIYFLYLRHAKSIVDYYLKHSNVNEDKIIFFHDIFTCYYYFKRVKKVNNVKYVLILHTDGSTFKMLRYYYPNIENTFVSKFLKHIESTVLEKVDNIGFVASKPLEVFKESFKRNDKDFFIYNGIKGFQYVVRDFSIFKLICVGSLSERKNQKELLTAISRLPRGKQERIELTLVGDGIIKQNLIEFVEKEKIISKITFLGFRTDIEELLVKSNIFILPSKDEGFPISILEAMSSGMPILASNVAGVPEMVSDGVNGLLFEPNVEDIHKALNRLFTVSLESLSLKSREIFEHRFTLDVMLDSYSEYFRNLS